MKSYLSSCIPCYLMDEKGQVVQQLSRLPGVSEKAAEGMFLLGIRSVDDLKGKNGDDMYAALRDRKDFFAEPCMQKMLKIAIGMADKGYADKFK